MKIFVFVSKKTRKKIKSVSDWLRAKKVGDHCHITRFYSRGAEQVLRNLITRQVVPSFQKSSLYHLKNYDGSMFFTEFFKRRTYKRTLLLIAKTDEEHASFTFDCTGSMESFKLLKTTLDELVKNLEECKKPK